MAHRNLSRHIVRRLLIAAVIGGIVAAGVTQLATSTSMTAPPTAWSAGEDRSRLEHTTPTPRPSSVDAVVVGGAGSSISAQASARAEGIAITGTHLARVPIVRSRGDLVTATSVTVAAAVTNGRSSAHAFVRNARYSRYALGSLVVHCRDGVPEVERTEIVQLTRTIQVRYGQANGNRITGAGVLVFMPGDRVIRLVRVATVTCTAGSPATPTSGSSTQQAGPDAPHPSRAAQTPSLTPRATAPGDPDALERRLIPRAPARPVSFSTTGPVIE